MILQTGILYGLLTDVFIYLLYNRVLRRVMNYYMAHVLQFLHLTSNVPNLVLIGIDEVKNKQQNDTIFNNNKFLRLLEGLIILKIWKTGQKVCYKESRCDKKKGNL